MHWAFSAGAYNAGAMNQPATPTRTDTQELPAVISAEFLAILRRYGVIEANLFGSVARGEEGPDSDIDLLVKFGQQVSLFRQMDLAEELSQLSGRKIDLMTNIDPAFAPYIIPTLVPIPV
jgi:predicted nucleotidyltransferase